jgi:type II secretory pathway predicted ATPase ExeA
MLFFAWLLFSLFFIRCKQSEKPVVLCIDEVHTLVGDTLISLLRQLRSR